MIDAAGFGFAAADGAGAADFGAVAGVDGAGVAGFAGSLILLFENI